jgi:hypothetical protein
MSGDQPASQPSPHPYSRTNRLATAVLVMGLVNATVGLCAFGVLGLISIGLGLGALLSLQPEERGRGMAWAGISLGVVPTLALVVLLVIGVSPYPPYPPYPPY